MNLFSLIAALLLEQLQPLSSRQSLHAWHSNYAGFFRHHFNTGEYDHGKIAWLLAVLPILVVTAIVYLLLHDIHPLLSMAFNVLVLYLCLDFGRYSHYFAKIRIALLGGRLEEARELLFRWRNIPSRQLSAEEIARIAIEVVVIASLRHLFAVIFWFMLFGLIGLGGAVGALFYRLGQIMYASWEIPVETAELTGETFDGFARKMLYLLEWVPVRLTAATFAISGNFEDTVYCWRSQSIIWPDKETGILLASAAGAAGIRLGMPVQYADGLQYRPELGINEKPHAQALQCAIRLIGRSTVLWMILLFMFTLAGMLG